MNNVWISMVLCIIYLLYNIIYILYDHVVLYHGIVM